MGPVLEGGDPSTKTSQSLTLSSLCSYSGALMAWTRPLPGGDILGHGVVSRELSFSYQVPCGGSGKVSWGELRLYVATDAPHSLCQI